MRRPWWAVAGPVRGTRGQYPLQTSSNRSSLNPLASAHVTNVVNLRPKTLIFSEKAVGLTTFVTTDQKSTRKTPPIDDVCNNTQRRAPKSQHDKPDHSGGPKNPAAVPAGGGGASPRHPWAISVTNVVKPTRFKSPLEDLCYKRRQSKPKNHHFQRKSLQIDDVCNNGAESHTKNTLD